jgi:hypothetical protein
VTVGSSTEASGGFVRREPSGPGGALPVASAFLLACAYGAFVLCAAHFVFTSDGQRFPAVFVAITTFILTQFFVHAARPAIGQPLSPKNWTILMFALQLLVMPTLIVWLGPARGVLPHLPDDSAINAAILLNAVAYVSFLAGYGIQLRLRKKPPAEVIRARGPWSLESSAAVIGIFLLLGTLGLVFRFQTWSNFLDYFLGRADLSQILADRGSTGATLVQAAGTFLVGALGFAFILLSCRFIERLRDGSAQPRLLIIAKLSVSIGSVALTYAVYLFNRGAVLVPILALAAAFSLRKRRISFPVIAVAGIVLLWGALQFGNIRAAYFHPGSASVDDLQQIQIYGSAPQFTAFMLQQNVSDYRLYPGQTIVSSFLYPFPVLGRDFRPTSGVEIYNRSIYGVSGVTDQVVPFQGELFWNFGPMGVAIGFLFLGAIVSRLQFAFERARSALTAYMVLYLSVWLGFLVIGSLAVVSQIIIYFMWPFAVALILDYLGNRPRGHPVAASRA